MRPAGFYTGRDLSVHLAEAAGIPKARGYGVLDSLADRGFVEVIPGRPKEYKPKSPAEIMERAAENRRQEFEQFRRDIAEVREAFLAEFQPRYERAHKEVTPTEELFHVVDVGDPSESETRRLYHEAAERVNVITNSFAYFEAVEPAFREAVERVSVDALFLHPDLLAPEKRPVQADTVEYIRSTYPDVCVRFSTDRLPWRGTIVDPSMEYDSGEAIFLVEEPEVPNHMRQAAITENGSMVAGLKRYFDLVWDHESVASPDQSG
ncbi:MAG: TrmB family transcriptional regulator [Halobacteriales archaeon SW_9_67_25]|nr:MAG: TrmB family transcriptional regulator [Halobacteriales archaeon SW_9_67_25]